MSALPRHQWLLTIAVLGGIHSIAAADTAMNGGAVITGSYLLQIISGLAFVVALIIGLAWLMRRVSGTVGSNRQLIDILAVRAVGTRERLLLVQIGDEQLLIGVTPNGIDCLHHLTQPLDLSNAAPSVNFGSNFATILRKRLQPNS
ncbi:flagellar biosynthetic protein FliO [Thiospirillum jenense]|uniref:Flagellar protein n=1 Tax=Thiospirillum jenense TaxID=1653858 RepID=A0A839HC89_9GAMM|nr:flagellar biosynthetic protein FliO [Thiospirillum jenense]MBB1125770.1 flagellar biosynthetic protein FliO [Thiospirillum jenense]